MTKNPAFWRRTPPALFPSCLGLLGLSLLWRALTPFEFMKFGYAEAICLLAVVVYAVTQLCYWAKIATRPAVLMEDLSVLPARGAYPPDQCA